MATTTSQLHRQQALVCCLLIRGCDSQTCNPSQGRRRDWGQTLGWLKQVCLNLRNQVPPSKWPHKCEVECRPPHAWPAPASLPFPSMDIRSICTIDHMLYRQSDAATVAQAGSEQYSSVVDPDPQLNKMAPSMYTVQLATLEWCALCGKPHKNPKNQPRATSTTRGICACQ